MKTTLRDSYETERKVTIVNGVRTEVQKGYDSRQLVVELTPGEDGVPDRIDYYDTGKHFLPQRLVVGWSRKPVGQVTKQQLATGGTRDYVSKGDWSFSIRIEGQGYAKDGKTPLKGKSRRDDGTLGRSWPRTADDVEPPEWVHTPWIRNFWMPHDPNLGWPQEVTTEVIEVED